MRKYEGTICKTQIYTDDRLEPGTVILLTNYAGPGDVIPVPREMFEGWADALADAYDIIPRDKWPIRLRLANMSNSLTALLSTDAEKEQQIER